MLTSFSKCLNINNYLCEKIKSLNTISSCFLVFNTCFSFLSNYHTRIPLYELIEIACDHWNIFRQRFWNLILVWSQILPHETWRYSQDVVAMNSFCVRVNRAAALTVLELGGCYIWYPDLVKDINQFLRPGRVHLTKLGYKHFSKQHQGGGGGGVFCSKKWNVFILTNSE